MKSDMHPKAESETLSDFVKVMGTEGLPMSDSVNKRNGKWIENQSPGRLNFSRDDVKNGLGQLVLTLVKLIHELLERQAIRRIEAGSLSDEEIENLGMTLMQQAQEIERLRKEFNLEEEDLNLDLGPLGKLL
jgi:hypothetical protein